MKRTTLAIVSLGFLGALLGEGPRVKAQDAPAVVSEKPRREADEAAIRAASHDLAQAFEKGDARAVAQFWTAEGEYRSDDGPAVEGRSAVEAVYAKLFATKADVKVESKTESVRFLGSDTAVEDGTFTIRDKDAPARSSRFNTLYVRQDGRWLIAMLKEWDDTSSEKLTLTPLEWLVGTWEGGGDEATAKVTYDWSPTKAFLHARFAVVPKKGEAAPLSGGTQIIGVDPAERVIRAWTFAPDGGFGSAVWTQDGKGWAIESEGTQADGSRSTALNLLVPDGPDAFTWRSVRRTVAGSDEPDLAPIKVRRVRDGK